jgi:phosphoribosylformimino-5-aminoimidazole carboxamide ribotide isomerase
MLRKFKEFGAKEFIFTDIKRDGTLAGPNVEGLKKILSETDLGLISAGGVKTIDDVKDLIKLEPMGLSGAIVGRALYEGTIDLREAINAGKKNNPVS